MLLTPELTVSHNQCLKPLIGLETTPRKRESDLELLKRLRGYGIIPRAILHIGPPWGEEALDYTTIGVKNVLIVEAISEVFKQLTCNLESYRSFLPDCAVCSDRTGLAVQFDVSSDDAGLSNMPQLGNHANIYPAIQYVGTLQLSSITTDDLVKTHAPGQQFELVVLNTQGSELHVLRGTRHVLKGAKALLIEVSDNPSHKGGCTFDQVTAHVRQFGFRLRQVQIRPQGWGDALYVKVCYEERGFAGPWLVKYLWEPLSGWLNAFRQRMQLEREILAIRQSSLFDRNWYLEQYPDVKADGTDPARHYAEHGWRERRDPGPQFSTKKWLKEHPGFEPVDCNPLTNYLRLRDFPAAAGRGRGK